jgi:hypothetical protein
VPLASPRDPSPRLPTEHPACTQYRRHRCRGPSSRQRGAAGPGPLARAGVGLVTALLMAHVPAWSQSACSSDGQPLRSAVVERFLSADCERCWTTAPPVSPPPQALELDWVLPGTLGDDAPLSAVARRDGVVRQQRLHSTGRWTLPTSAAAPASTANSATPHASADPAFALPPQVSIIKNKSNKPNIAMRLAHGLPYNDYVAASIQVPTGIANAQGGQAWLVLLEALPAGTEGSPVARYLVRNSLVLDLPPRPWARPVAETRSLWIPPGTQPDRLRVAGWIETRQGQLLWATQTQCAEAR